MPAFFSTYKFSTSNPLAVFELSPALAGGKDNHFFVNLPNKTGTKVSCNADEYNRVSIVKKDKEYQVYLNNMFVTSDLFENKAPFINFSFSCRLDTLSMANFSGIEL